MRVLVLNDLEEEVRNRFRDFVPKEFEGLMEEGCSFMIGAVEPEPDGMEAAGITLVTLEDEEFVVKWVWVDPDYRYKEAGSKMMDALFATANENGMETIAIQIPSLKDEYAPTSEEYQFFFDFAFGDAEIKTIDGIKVFELSADVDEYLAQENTMANEAIREERIDKGYDKFPKKFVATGVEYYSGVPVAI